MNPDPEPVLMRIRIQSTVFLFTYFLQVVSQALHEAEGGG
jgi:hypothetical protein